MVHRLSKKHRIEGNTLRVREISLHDHRYRENSRANDPAGNFTWMVDVCVMLRRSMIE